MMIIIIILATNNIMVIVIIKKIYQKYDNEIYKVQKEIIIK